MSSSLYDIINIYKQALAEKRVIYGVVAILVATVTLILALLWPKTYTASSTIYADNSSILRPLIARDAVVRESGVDQSIMAKDILFSREHTDAILEAGGLSVNTLTPLEKEQQIEIIQNSTVIDNVGRGAARLVMISHSDSDPIKAYRITQKYTSIFIEQSALTEQQESQKAFDFIQKQVDSYQQKLQDSENKLSNFKSENNFGTIENANNRIAGYRSEIERLDLNLVQVNTQLETVEAQLTGEMTVSRDVNELNSVRARINSLQINLDNLRARFHDSYPDIVQIKNQISDLQNMLDSGQTSNLPMVQSVDREGYTPLHQELRSRLAVLQSNKQAMLSERDSILLLLSDEESRARRINETEAELAELTRDYNVTQNFYNSMLQNLETARVSVNLNDEAQGIMFKIQESAVVPSKPDGFTFTQLVLISLVLAMGVPIGLMVVMVEMDPRIRSESNWQADWPPLLGVIPPIGSAVPWWRSNYTFIGFLLLVTIALYGSASFLHIFGYLY